MLKKQKSISLLYGKYFQKMIVPYSKIADSVKVKF